MSPPPSIPALIAAAGQARDSGRLDEAEAALRVAVAHDPGSRDARLALGVVLLSAGRFAEAWPLYEARPAPRPDLPFPEWDGGPVRRLLVWGEQGFGDQIMFARFLPVLADRGIEVTFLCRPGLERLFAQLPARVIPGHGTVEFPDPDAWVMANSLPYRLNLTPDSLPGGTYLRVEPRPGRRGVGVMAAGNPAHANDAHRSLPPREAERLLSLPGAVDLRPESTGVRDFQDTAEIVAGLELVVSVDTATAHLAGALGAPTWLLLTAVNPDWRWMIGAEDSRWYPSMRLIRQPRPGDWRAVLDRVESELRAAAGLRPPRRAD